MLAHDVTIGFVDDATSYSRLVDGPRVVYSPVTNSANIGGAHVISDLSAGRDVLINTDGNGDQRGDLTISSLSASGNGANHLRLEAAGDVNIIGTFVEATSLEIRAAGTFNLIGNSSVDSDGELNVEADSVLIGVDSSIQGMTIELLADQVEVSGTIGGETPVRQLSIDSFETIVAAEINSNGAVEFAGPLTLIGSTEVLIESQTGPIQFGSTIDDVVDGFSELTIRSGGEVRFLGDIGSLSPFNSVDVIAGETVRFRNSDGLKMGMPVSRGGGVGVQVIHLVSLQSIFVTTPAPWQNLIQPSDVNDDGSVSPLDALLVINQLSTLQYTHGANAVFVNPSEVTQWPSRYYDQNGDNLATPVDALRIINEVARNHRQSVPLTSRIVDDKAEEFDGFFTEFEPGMF